MELDSPACSSSLDRRSYRALILISSFFATILTALLYVICVCDKHPLSILLQFKSHPYVNNPVKGGKVTEDIPGMYSSDPYDVKWYDDADDFASDWADDFDDYDDAYMYWEDHH